MFDIGRVGARFGHQPELKLGGRAQQILEPLRILQSGHFDEDAVVALRAGWWVRVCRVASMRRRSTSID